MSDPLSILYLLEETAISGTVQTVCSQADALVELGHRVRVATRGLPLDWRPSLAEWSYVERYEQAGSASDDFVVAASWETVEAACRIGGGRALHLCLSAEPGVDAEARVRTVIEAALALPVTRLVPSAHVASGVARFGSPAREFPVIVAEPFFCSGPRVPGERRRVLLCGQWDDVSHGLEYGYGAAAHARWFHQRFDLVRVSAWAPSREEPLDAVQEFHVALTSAEMTRLVQSCDVLIAPNTREEGFSLPAAEAMASGLACVMSASPAFSAISPERDFALFAPEGNAVELGERLIEILGDDERHARLSARAIAVAQQWRTADAGRRLEALLRDLR